MIRILMLMSFQTSLFTDLHSHFPHFILNFWISSLTIQLILWCLAWLPRTRVIYMCLPASTEAKSPSTLCILYPDYSVTNKINNSITFKLQTFTRPECNWRAFEDVVMKLPESGSGNSTLLAWWLQQQVFQLSESEKKQTAFHDLVTDNLDFNL